MVDFQDFVLAALLASFASASASDLPSRSLYDASLSRRDIMLQQRGEIADILDKNPNIKSLIAPYSDLIDGLIRRDGYGLKTRDGAGLNPWETRRLALRSLKFRQLARRVAEAKAEAEAEAEAEADADADADPHAAPEPAIEADKVYAREAAAAAEPYAESGAEEVEIDPRNIMTTVFQGNVENAKNSRREALPQSQHTVDEIYSRDAMAESNIMTTVFQGNVENAKNSKREALAESAPEVEEIDARDAVAEPNIMTTVFQGNVESAQKNSKRSLEPAPVYEATASIFTRMYKSGGDFLNGLADRFKKKRDPEAAAEAEAGIEFESSLLKVAKRSLELIGDAGDIRLSNFKKREPFAEAVFADPDIFEEP